MSLTRRFARLTLWSASLISISAWAASATPAAHDRDTQRAAIIAARSETNARFEAQRKVCQGQFAVSACMSDAAKAQRVALRDLRQRELALNEAERHETTAAREQALAAKAVKSAASQPSAKEAGLAKPEHGRTPPKPNPNPLIHAKSSPSDAQSADAARAARHAKEARNEDAFAAKALAASEHRDAVLRRNAERAASGKVAAPLPKAASEP